MATTSTSLLATVLPCVRAGTLNNNVTEIYDHANPVLESADLSPTNGSFVNMIIT